MVPGRYQWTGIGGTDVDFLKRLFEASREHGLGQQATEQGLVSTVILDEGIAGPVLDKFAPEATLIKGATSRIALGFRIRRFYGLCVRSVIVGDVPLGAFWFGWHKTKWTPNGYEGWTTGKVPAVVRPI